MGNRLYGDLVTIAKGLASIHPVARVTVLALVLTFKAWLILMWVHAERKAAFLEGRQSVYTELTAQPSDGTCFAKGGCR